MLITICLLIAIIAIIVLWVGNQPGHRRVRHQAFYTGPNRRSDTTETDPFGRPFVKLLPDEEENNLSHH